MQIPDSFTSILLNYDVDLGDTALQNVLSSDNIQVTLDSVYTMDTTLNHLDLLKYFDDIDCRSL